MQLPFASGRLQEYLVDEWDEQRFCAVKNCASDRPADQRQNAMDSNLCDRPFYDPESEIETVCAGESHHGR
jgi:hypothetical protein